MSTLSPSGPLNVSNPTNEPTNQSETQPLASDEASTASNALVLHEKSLSQQPTTALGTPNRGVMLEIIVLASKMSPHEINLSRIAQLELKFQSSGFDNTIGILKE